MRHNEPETIILPLRDLHDLFAAPEYDPAHDRADNTPTAADTFTDELYEPGIDYLVSRLHGRSLTRRGQLVLAVPPGMLHPALASTARRAIDRYCKHKILETKRALNELLWSGLKSLQVGILFLAGCLVLAAAIAKSN